MHIWLGLPSASTYWYTSQSVTWHVAGVASDIMLRHQSVNPRSQQDTLWQHKRFPADNQQAVLSGGNNRGYRHPGACHKQKEGCSVQAAPGSCGSARCDGRVWLIYFSTTLASPMLTSASVGVTAACEAAARKDNSNHQHIRQVHVEHPKCWHQGSGAVLFLDCHSQQEACPGCR